MTPAVLLDPAIQAILSQPYGRFSDQEFERRRRALTEVQRRHGCDAIVVCGEERTGTGVYWLTGWPTSAEAMVVFASGERDVLFVEFHNHVPNARVLARDADVRWARRQGAAAVVEELKRRGARSVGVIGLLSWRKSRQLGEHFELVDLSDDYQWLRMRKSDEEIAWMRIGAAFSDLGLQALLREARIGMTERELGALVEREYHALGGSTVIHFIGINAMDGPQTCVPPQHHSSRCLQARDMMFVEFSGSFWDYPGQVLRTIAVGAEPTPLFNALYETAEAAFDAITRVLRAGASSREIVQASKLIEEAGFAIHDDLVHGFGGGYWPPVLGANHRSADDIPDLRLEANMTLVVQPNVITRDERAGVQLGEMVRITEAGFERMHAAPWGFLRIG
ncbi:MAG TPA: M24 family metallopeptidase [Casimicrobiaceae bacterium]|nr:M24 family metallopeptidase [Casimicrobiaceae bacterium]